MAATNAAPSRSFVPGDIEGATAPTGVKQIALTVCRITFALSLLAQIR
jgi:hypothetical protein